MMASNDTIDIKDSIKSPEIIDSNIENVPETMTAPETTEAISAMMNDVSLSPPEESKSPDEEPSFTNIQPSEINEDFSRSKNIRKELLSSPPQPPLPTWTTTLSSVISTGRYFLNSLSNNVILGQSLTLGRKVSAPVPFDTIIQKVQILRRHDLVVEGMDANLAKGFITAEWVEFDTKGGPPHDRVIIYLHGGAYAICCRRTHRMVTWRLAKYANAKVLTIDYRLAPQFTFPTPIADVLSAYAYLVDPPTSSGRKKWNPEQISFAGDSAGGGLALAAMLWCRDTKKLPIPGAVAAMSPYCDLSHSLPAWILNENYCYLPGGVDDPNYISETRSNLYVKHDDDLIHPYASPIYAKEDLTNPISPTLIQVGGAERVRDDGIFFATKTFANSPVELEIFQDQVHVFHIFSPFDGFADYACKRLATFLMKNTGTFSSSTSSSSSTRREKPVPQKSAIYVRSKPPYHQIPLPDAEKIIEDGEKVLFKSGVWKEGESRALNAVKKRFQARDESYLHPQSMVNVYEIVSP